MTPFQRMFRETFEARVLNLVVRNLNSYVYTHISVFPFSILFKNLLYNQ